MDTVIRIATLNDIPLLQRLIPQSARELSKHYYTPQQIESAIRYIFGVDTQLISDQTYYVAVTVTRRFNQPLPDGIDLPLAHMQKALIRE